VYKTSVDEGSVLVGRQVSGDLAKRMQERFTPFGLFAFNIPRDSIKPYCVLTDSFLTDNRDDKTSQACLRE
jgi:hypothetical protein